ncbi:hypothetical protein [Halorubellus salinus]|uniref:hypothetical protein n=1 Tax=Halorubellus salinus TaxID=755309 RepID=UPI001D0612A0|nr:hypothetical protein [Halorubellus salinus]
MTRTRRSLLKVAAASGAVALAGCSSILGGSGGASETQWLYQPGTVGDVDHYLSLRYKPSAIAERAANFDDDVYDAMRSFGSSARDLVGFEFGTTDAQLAFGKNAVLAADFEADDVASTLEAEEFSDEDAYKNYDVYVGPDEDAAVGIGSSEVVVARSTGIFGSADNAEAVLEGILDVNAGDAESYAADNEDFKALTDAFGDSAIQSMRTYDEVESTDTDDGDFAGEVARGIDSVLVDDGIETTFVRVFNEASDIDDGDIEDWVDADDTFDEFQDVEISTNGRVVEVTGTEATGAYDFYVGSA